MRVSFARLTGVALATVLAVGISGAPATAAPAAVPIPPGVTTGYVVYDRQTGATPVQYQSRYQFRSASLVKIIIALDYLERRGPSYQLTPTELNGLQIMLRRSDNKTAKEWWIDGGRTAVITRMAAKMGLQDTTPPADPVYWGYTAISAADMLKVYRYLWEKAHPNFRNLVGGNLRLAARCSQGGDDQFFGIPRAIPKPWSIKQGWSGTWTNHPPACVNSGPVTPRSNATEDGAEASPDVLRQRGNQLQAGVDLTRPAMHTSGLAGNDRYFVIVMTLHTKGVAWNTHTSAITALTKAAYTEATTAG